MTTARSVGQNAKRCRRRTTPKKPYCDQTFARRRGWRINFGQTPKIRMPFEAARSSLAPCNKRHPPLAKPDRQAACYKPTRGDGPPTPQADTDERTMSTPSTDQPIAKSSKNPFGSRPRLDTIPLAEMLVEVPISVIDPPIIEANARGINNPIALAPVRRANNRTAGVKTGVVLMLLKTVDKAANAAIRITNPPFFALPPQRAGWFEHYSRSILPAQLYQQ